MSEALYSYLHKQFRFILSIQNVLIVLKGESGGQMHFGIHMGEHKELQRGRKKAKALGVLAYTFFLDVP